METRRILFIDDNPAIHDDYRKILCAAPVDSSEFTEDDEFLFGKTEAVHPQPMFDADSAFQGEEGLQFVRQAVEEHRPYQVALVDIRMPPGWDGVETARKIWEIDRNVLVIFCTAYSDYSWTEMSSSLGRQDQFVILKKPFDNLELLQLVTALSKKWELERQSDFGMEQLSRTLEEQSEHHRREMSDFVDRIRIACVDMAYRQSKHELHTAETKRLTDIANEFEHKSHAHPQGDVSVNGAVTSGSFLGEISQSLDHALKDMVPSLDAAGIQSASMQKARLSATSLLSVIRNLHCLSLLDTDRFQLTESLFPVSELLRPITDFAKPMADTANIAFSSHCDVDQTLTITGDCERMCHLLYNVIGNAFRFTNVGSVELHIEPLGDGWLSFEVSDTGCGISETQAKSLFQLFNTEVPPGNSTGDFRLGLLVCKRIIDFMGGQIEFESREDCGSTFRIVVPILQRANSNETEKAELAQ